MDNFTFSTSTHSSRSYSRVLPSNQDRSPSPEVSYFKGVRALRTQPLLTVNAKEAANRPERQKSSLEVVHIDEEFHLPNKKRPKSDIIEFVNEIPTSSNLDGGIGSKIVIVYPGADTLVRDQVTIFKEDMTCLEPGQMLNDNIVYFYLKYLTLEKFNKALRDRVHLFNTFFYSKLSQITKDSTKASDIGRWFKNVDLFSKDFLVIPVCSHLHWFLIIVCYPGNVLHTSDDPITIDDSNQDMKEPVILIMDSLRRRRRQTFTQPVRDFLRTHWRERKEKFKDFNQNNMKDIWAKVPTQQNSYDCGLYILRYFEHFFQEPDKNMLRLYCNEDFSDWFESNSVSKMRRHIRFHIGIIKHKQEEIEKRKKRFSLS